MKLKKYVAVFAVVSLMTIGRSDASPTVHPGDTLGIDVLNYAAVIDDSQGRLKALNAGDVVVAGDGSISIPVVGTINVAGKSTYDISQLIESKLAPYVHDPSVTVRLLQQSQLIFLTGATIGTIPYLPGETLASALGQLRQQLEKDYADNLTTSDKNGGTLLRSSIDLRNIVIVRDQRADAPINGEELLRSGQPGPALSPGDTLQLASKPVRVDIKGDVAAPGSIYLYPNDTLEEALLQAGGPLPSASTADASLIRNGKDTPITLAGATLRDVPQNGDIIIVKAAPHVTVLGQVPTPGDYTLKNGSTLLTALYDAGGPTKWANVKDIQVVHNGTRSTYNLDGLTHGDLSTNVPLVDGDVVYVPEGHKIDVTPILQGIAGALSATYNASHL